MRQSQQTRNPRTPWQTTLAFTTALTLLAALTSFAITAPRAPRHIAQPLERVAAEEDLLRDAGRDDAQEQDPPRERRRDLRDRSRTRRREYGVHGQRQHRHQERQRHTESDRDQRRPQRRSPPTDGRRGSLLYRQRDEHDRERESPDHTEPRHHGAWLAEERFDEGWADPRRVEHGHGRSQGQAKYPLP